MRPLLSCAGHPAESPERHLQINLAMRPHRVVALLNPPQSPFELSCATEVFGAVPPEEPPRYSFRVCAEHPGPLQTTAGYAMLVNAGLEALEQADTVIVPGWQPPAAPAPPAVTARLRTAHRRRDASTAGAAAKNKLPYG